MLGAFTPDPEALLAIELRKGIVEIQRQYKVRLCESGFYESWAYISMYEKWGCTWSEHESKQERFAVDSQRLLARIAHPGD